MTALLIVLLGHVVVGWPATNLLGRTINNVLHIPAFALIASAIWWCFVRPRIFSVLAAALVVAVVSEAAQLVTARQASVADLALDCAGIAVALSAWYGADRWRWNAAAVSWLIAHGVLLVFITALAPVSIYLQYAQRDAVFPNLFTPSDWAETAALAETRSTRPESSLISSNSDGRLVVAPADWPAWSGETVLELTWSRDRYPGLHIHEVVPKWDDYSELVAELFVIGVEPVRVTLAVGHRGIPGTSAYVPQLVGPGAAELRIPLQRLTRGSDGHPAALSHLILHGRGEDAGRRLLLASIRLE